MWAVPKLQLLWGVSRQQLSVSIQRGPRKEQRSMSRAKAHPCMWGSGADLSGLTQQSSYCSLECNLEEVHTGSGRKVLGDTAHNNLLSEAEQRLHRGVLTWPTRPGKSQKYSSFQPAVRKTARQIVHDGKVIDRRRYKPNIGGKLLFFFFQHMAAQLRYRFLKLFRISGQQKPWTMQAVPPFT